MESPLTVFVLYALEAFLNFHHSQHFSVSHLTPCELFLLIVPHITLPHCIKLNPAVLHLSITEEVPFDSLTWRDHLLTGPDDL